MAGLVAAAVSLTFLVVNGDNPNAATPTAGPSTASTPAVTTTALATTLPPTTVPSPTPPAANPATIVGVIASLQADPDAFGRRANEVIRDLEKISRGEGDMERRTVDLLRHADEWVDKGELDPAVLAMLEAALVPPAADSDDDVGGDD